MSNHPSREELIQYRNRTLSPHELVAVDGHLAGCQDCRRGLAELATPASAAAVLSGIRQAEDEHLTYDQMDAWVEDQLDQSGRELVMAHIGLCSACARQLQAYQSYAPVMSAPLRTPAKPAPTFADRLRALWANPRIAAIATAAVVLAVLSPLVLVKRTQTGQREFADDLRRNGSALSPTTPTLDTAELDALPSSLRSGAVAALNAPASQRPAALSDLPPNPDSNVKFPVSEVIEETQPDFEWKAFAASYTVSIYDSGLRLVAMSPALSETHWHTPVPLERGARYTWEVRAAGVTHRAAFRVLGRSESEQLARARASNPGPLALGAVAESLGLISLAQQEFETMAKRGSQSQQGAILLDRINSLRGH